MSFTDYFDIEKRDIFTVEKSDKDVYHIIKFLAAGTSGRVYKAVSCSTKKLVAIKYLTSADEKEFKDEWEILSQLTSICGKNAVCGIDTYSYPDEKGEEKYRIVMEYINGGYDLKKYMKEIPLETTSELIGRVERDDVAVHLVLALNALHESGISHQDIKELNIMWDFSKNIPKFADFGGSCSLYKDCDSSENQLCKGQCGFLGTEHTVPPEMIGSMRIYNLIQSSRQAIPELTHKIKYQQRRKRQLENNINKLKLKRGSIEKRLSRSGALTRFQTQGITEIGNIEMDIDKTVNKVEKTVDKIKYFDRGLNAAIKTYQTYLPQLSTTVTAPGTFISTRAHDIWALGITLYNWYKASDLETDVGHYPALDTLISSLSQAEIYKRIQEIPNSFARELLTMLLEKSPSNRTRHWKNVLNLAKSHKPKIFVTPEYITKFGDLMNTDLLPEEQTECRSAQMKNILRESVSSIIATAHKRNIDLNLPIKDLIVAFGKL